MSISNFMRVILLNRKRASNRWIGSFAAVFTGFFFIFSFLPEQSQARWIDDYVNELSEQVDEFQASTSSSVFSPNKLLPLSTMNSWRYRFDNVLNGLSESDDEDMELGPLESAGDFCVRPLRFGDGHLQLLLANHNDRIMLYGFRGELEKQPVEIMFKNGDSLGFDEGILLVTDSLEQVEQSQKGKFPGIINGQKVTLEWFAVNKTLTSAKFDDANLKGFINGIEESVNDSDDVGEKVYSSFRLNLGPCQLESGCFVADFVFEFIPTVGLTYFQVKGDDSEQNTRYEYWLQKDPSIGYELDSAINTEAFFSCANTTKKNIGSSKQGLVSIWFNILLLFVVTLGSFVRYDFVSPKQLQS